MIEAPSPNHDERPPGPGVDHLVLHYTGMQTGAAAIDRLCDPAPPTGVRVSSHYVVEEDGRVFHLVPEARRAWHAGISHWRGAESLNGRSIGIEIVNPGHEWGYRPFPARQVDAVVALCRGVLARHPILPVNVVGHSDIAPDRKGDPGELFPWPILAAAGIGLWPGLGGEPVAGPVPEPGIEQALRAIGYPVPDLSTTLRAFQRRWLPGEVSGRPTRATCVQLAAVQSLYRAEAA